MTTAQSAATAPANVEKRIRLLPISLFLLVPTLYVFGRSYWAAWLQQYGLSESTFPVSVDSAIYLSYEAVLWLGLAAFPWLTKLSLMVVVLIVLWALCALSLLAWNGAAGLVKRGVLWTTRRIASSIAEYRKRLEVPARAYSIAALPFLLWGGVLYAFLLLLVPLMLGHYVGEWQGQRSYEDLRKRIAEGAFKDGEQVAVLAGSGKAVRLVACSELGCAVADEGGTRFVRWDRIDQVTEGASQTDLLRFE